MQIVKFYLFPVFLLCILLVSGCERPDNAQLFFLTAKQAAAMWKDAEKREPIGERSVEVAQDKDGNAVRTARQAFRLKFSAGSAKVTISCQSSCRKLVINPGDPPKGCGVKSGCDPTPQGGCTELECEKDCFPFSCVKVSTGVGDPLVFQQYTDQPGI